MSEYIRKIMKLHTVDRSVNYGVDVGTEGLFLCEMETNGHSMILQLMCVYLPRKNSIHFFKCIGIGKYQIHKMGGGGGGN